MVVTFAKMNCAFMIVLQFVVEYIGVEHEWVKNKDFMGTMK